MAFKKKKIIFVAYDLILTKKNCILFIKNRIFLALF
jgi:hypothetical protein